MAAGLAQPDFALLQGGKLGLGHWLLLVVDNQFAKWLAFEIIGVFKTEDLGRFLINRDHRVFLDDAAAVVHQVVEG